MVSPETRLPPWDPANEAEQKIILFCPDYKTMLNRNRPELIRVTQPGPLWSYLRKYEVTNKEIEEQFKLNATSPEMMERLLDLLEVGPRWRFHAFLKGCKETNQPHVIQLLGLNPDGYDDMLAEGLIQVPAMHEVAPDAPDKDEPLSRAGGSDVKKIIQSLGNYVDTLKTQYNLKEPDTPCPQSVGEASPRYKLDYPRRGVAVIINIGEFDKKTHMSSRQGYKFDGDLMWGTFKQFGFDVQLHENIKTKEVLKLLHEVSKGDHSDTGCFILLFASHGENDVVYATDGTIHIKTLVEAFTSKAHPSWAGKPKLFFLQSSRGSNLDEGQELVIEGHEGESSPSTGNDTHPLRCHHNIHRHISSSHRPDNVDRHTVRIPLQADILLAWSTTDGYFSYRNSLYGSVFLRYLAKALVTYGSEEDILTILTRVNHMVAYGFEASGVSLINGKKLMPEFTSRLTKLLYFPAPVENSDA